MSCFGRVPKSMPTEGEGREEASCTVCGEVGFRTIPKDSHIAEVVNEAIEPNCTYSGKTSETRCRICARKLSEAVDIPATGHNYVNGVCTSCGDDITAECTCGCHADGIKGFFFRLGLFFQKIFKSNKVCECGAEHY